MTMADTKKPKPTHELLRDAWFAINLAEKRLWEVRNSENSVAPLAAQLEKEAIALRLSFQPVFQQALYEYNANKPQWKLFQTFLLWLSITEER